MAEQLVQLKFHKGKKTEEFNIPTKDVWEPVIKYIQEQKSHTNCIIQQMGTGVGKSTTFVAKLFETFPDHRVVCSQVTIVNTVGISKYLGSSYKGLTMGTNIGFQTSSNTVMPKQFNSIFYQTLKVTTNQILMKVLQGKLANASKYIVIIDEAHSNDVNSQEQLALLRALLGMNMPRDQMPLFIIQSASIDPEQYMTYFGQKEYISGFGQQHQTKQLYLEDFKLQKETSFAKSLLQVLNVVFDARESQKSNKENPVSVCLNDLKINPLYSVLIFITGQRQLVDLKQQISKMEYVKQNKIEVIGVSAIDVEANPRIVDNIDTEDFKIILATNVIETGYTINNLSVVIDCAKFKLAYRLPISKLEFLRDLPIDRSMQQQRKGRVGRTRSGIYIGMFSQNVELVKQKELQIQIASLDQLIEQHSSENFLQLQFMKPIPREHFVAYKQTRSMIATLSQPLVTQMLQKQSIFNSMRDIVFILMGMQQGYILFDILLICAVKNAQIKMKQTDSPNDVLDIVTDLYFMSDPQVNSYMQSYIAFFAKLKIDIYVGKSVKSDVKGIYHIISKVFYEFMCKRINDNEFETKTGFVIKVQLAKEFKFICATKILFMDSFKLRIVIPISQQHWDNDDCPKSK